MPLQRHQKKRLSKHSLDGMTHKSIIYGFMLILYPILENYTIGGDHPFELDLFSRYLVMAIVLKESLAVVENLACVTKIIPPWLIDKMRLLSDKGLEHTERKTTKENQKENQEPSVSPCQENTKENKPSSKPSEKALELIKTFEGFKEKAYKCPGGTWTIGYGHAKGVKPTDRIDKERAEDFLSEDLKEI